MFIRFGLAGLLLVSISMPLYAASYRELEQRINTLDERVARLEKLLSNQVLLEMVQRQERLHKEIQGLRGDNEVGLHEIELIKKRQRELYLGIDQRLQRLENAGQNPQASIADRPGPELTDGATQPGVAELPGVASELSTLETPQGSIPSPAAQNTYAKAFELLKERRYDDAIKALTGFLSSYPQSPYSGNAQYWLGEANYVSGNYPKAKIEFKKVIDDYPSSPKVPDARLKLGFTHYELGEWSAARQLLSGLSKQYPNSAVARLAEEQLKRIKHEGH
jgi:tol-pal system protein YbgF